MYRFNRQEYNNSFYYLFLKTYKYLFIFFLFSLIKCDISAQTYNNPPYTVSTVAGSIINGTGYSDGIGSYAIFSQPVGIVLDSFGNLYVADSTNYVVRKIDTKGITTTIAGQPGISGNKDGTANSALFGVVSGITIDSLGNLFVTDISNNTIRKISPSGSSWVTSTIVPTTSGLKAPSFIAIDNQNNLYVSDTKNYVIRKIAPSGSMITLAGAIGTSGGSDGLGVSAKFGSPEGLAVDSTGNIYVADSSNCTIRKITVNGSVTTIGGYWGAPGYGDGNLTTASAQFSHPYALTLDKNGNIFISDQSNQSVIREISTNGIVSTVVGIPNTTGSRDGLASVATLDTVQGLAIDSAGNIFISASGSSTIREAKQTSLTINAPIISIQPLNQNANIGSSATFTVSADGNSLSYQWYFNNTIILTATSNTYTLSNISYASAGTYSVNISNSAGSVSSSAATLTVKESSIPIILTQPTSQTVSQGSSLTLNVTTDAINPSYQWYFNGTSINGATFSSYTISSALITDAGSYTVKIKNTAGIATSDVAVITVYSKSSARLMNISVLSMDGPDSQLLTVGFVSGGAGTTGLQNLLIRAIGPTIGLPPFNVSNALTDPTLTLFHSNVALATNDDWGSPANNVALVNAANAATGAFTLPNIKSLDSALVTNLTSGAYSVQVAGKSGTSGNVIAEVYDNTPPNSYNNTTPRLINLSCLEQVATGGVLTIGFVIGGTTSEKVLIRASGPTLAATPYNLPGMLSDPKVTVFNNSSKVLAINAGWAGDASVSAANIATGAFQFINSSSKDSAVLLTLQPGAYTVQTTSATDKAGITLIEVYEVTN